MKISADWIRDFVSPAVDDRKMADELTHSGIGVEGYHNEGADLCYEAEVTTNRVDAMNHYGVAREVSAIFDIDLKPLTPKVNETKGLTFPIEIEDAEGCARYTARVVRGVKIGASPKNIAHRLELIDQRSISNVADATNYVLNEVGQPTHAFDLDKLAGKIVVRLAKEGEVLKTLDGVERKLSSEDLVIADASKAVALAGIMGGEATMITDSTKNVLIESAWFNPVYIRRTARRLGMHTDASHRFERGADYGITPTACTRVAELIQQSAGGEVGEEIDVVARKIAFPRVQLRHSEVRRILGADIPDQEISRILRRLGFVLTPGMAAPSSATTSVAGSAVTLGSGGAGAAVAETIADFLVDVPSWRLDVEREIDLIEEVARIYGYLKIPSTLPSFAGAVVELPTAEKDARLRTTLLALGYNESLSSTFVSKGEAEQFGGGSVVKLANPLSEEAGYMRTSLVPGLLAQVAYNLNRGTGDVRLFESGHVFQQAGESVDERVSLAFIATGSAVQPGVHGKSEPYTFFHAKGHIEEIVGLFETKEVKYDREVPSYYHPGRSARVLIGGKEVARFGQVHPEIAAARKLKQDVYLAEILVENLYAFELRAPHYRPIAKFPAVERDFSMLFPEGTEFEKMRAAVEALNIEELQSLAPVEIFRGGSLPKDRYSLLIRARFQSPDRTLRDEEVSQWSQHIVKAMESLGGAMRS